MLNYKEYDNLNIKILVNYIKPSTLFKSNILTPIHLGRSVAKEMSKDGIISDEDLNWLHQNCLSDNDFEGNISHLNRKIGFLTGTYWAWKNYNKLGAPEYFGSFGYRRLFESSFLKELYDYDFYAPTKLKITPDLKNQFIQHHGEQIYHDTCNTLSQIYPEEVNLWNIYMSQDYGYFWEIYVMKKQIFFDFCEWIFPLMNNLLKISKDENQAKILKNFSETQNILNYYDNRLIGFAIERLTGYFLFKLFKTKKGKEVNVLILDDKNTENKRIERQKQLSKILRQHIKEK